MNIKITTVKAFTLIELVVVIVILGILSAVIYPQFQNMVRSANMGILNGAIAAGQSAAAIGYAQSSGIWPTPSAICGLIMHDGAFNCVDGVITISGAPDPTQCSATYVAGTTTTVSTFTSVTTGC